MPESTHLQIAIVGSGPSGCYLAQALTRALPTSHITLFDRLAAPFGLIRYGVAADHQHTKAITRQFERLFESEQVRFAGNVDIATDVTLDELRRCYDIVVLATGLSADRQLDIPGGNLPGVLGSGELTRALNAHPDAISVLPELGPDVVVIGAGNVALDVLRFLVKGSDDYAASDISDDMLSRYLEAPAARVTLASRSTARLSKGDPQMLRELAALPRAQYASPDRISEATTDRTESARIAAVEELVSADRPTYPGPSVLLRFGLVPLRILGDHHVEAVEFAYGDEVVRVPASSVITAVGFAPLTDGSLSQVLAEHSESGRVLPGLYRTGWAKRGPRGAIPENRACAKSVADEILTDLNTQSAHPSAPRPGFDGLPLAVKESAISYAQWLKLDAHEREHAPSDRVRRKLPHHEHMIKIARG